MSDKRVPNFCAAETELLTSLVKKYAHVLENKKTDAVNNQLKDEMWSQVADDFNSGSGICIRNSKTLRAKYENIKKSLKRKFGEHRRSLYGTGGGPSQDHILTQGEQSIIELAGPSVEGLPSRYDSDVVLKPVVQSEPMVQVEEIFEVPTVNDHSTKSEVLKAQEEKPSTINISTPNCFILRKRKSTPLRRDPESFNSTMQNYRDLSQIKQDLAAAQIRQIEEKLAQEKIMHDLRCAQIQKKKQTR